MKLKSTIFFIISFNLFCSAQTEIRPLEKLINKEEPGWPIVKEWIEKALNKVEVLPVNSSNANDALFQTQVTTKSPMGAIIYMTGGILIDDGWLRILGSGSKKLNRSLPAWSKGKAFDEFGQTNGYLLIADDAIGGFYLLNGGALGQDLGKVYYFSPDNLKYEPLNLSYTSFINFCFNADLNEFYKGLKWKKWREDVKKLDGNKVFNFYPFLWTQEGAEIEKLSRKIVPIEEQYIFNMQSRKSLSIK
jgi:hypothetical protein